MTTVNDLVTEGAVAEYLDDCLQIRRQQILDSVCSYCSLPATSVALHWSGVAEFFCCDNHRWNGPVKTLEEYANSH